MGKQGKAVASVALGLALVVPATAAAKIDAGDVKDASTVTGDSSVPSGAGGGFVSCPAGTKVFTGGTYWYSTGGTVAPTMVGGGQHAVTSSSPTLDGNGWFAAGYNEAGVDLTLRTVVRCLPEGKLEDVIVRQKTQQVPIDPPAVGARRVECPNGTRVISGGAFWHDPGPDPGPDPNDGEDAELSSSTPLGGSSWYADGRHFTAVPRELTVVARCLPKEDIKSYTKDKAVFELEAGAAGLTSQDCNGGRAAGPAGGFWHKPGKGPEKRFAKHTRLVNVGSIDDPKAFTAGVVNLTGPLLRFRAQALCVDR